MIDVGNLRDITLDLGVVICGDDDDIGQNQALATWVFHCGCEIVVDVLTGEPDLPAYYCAKHGPRGRLP